MVPWSYSRVDTVFDPATSLLVARRDLERGPDGAWFETVRMRIIRSDVVRELPRDLRRD